MKFWIAETLCIMGSTHSFCLRVLQISVCFLTQSEDMLVWKIEDSKLSMAVFAITL